MYKLWTKRFGLESAICPDPCLLYCLFLGGLRRELSSAGLYTVEQIFNKFSYKTKNISFSIIWIHFVHFLKYKKFVQKWLFALSTYWRWTSILNCDYRRLWKPLLSKPYNKNQEMSNSLLFVAVKAFQLKTISPRNQLLIIWNYTECNFCFSRQEL